MTWSDREWKVRDRDKNKRKPTTYVLRGLAKSNKFKNADVTLEVGGWMHVSLGEKK